MVYALANTDIKQLIRKKRLFRYEVAEAMGISEGYLSKLLREPLTEERRIQIIEAVSRLTNNTECEE
jgi:predicted XRE-type DNA-binding protein